MLHSEISSRHPSIIYIYLPKWVDEWVTDTSYCQNIVERSSHKQENSFEKTNSAVLVRTIVGATPLHVLRIALHKCCIAFCFSIPFARVISDFFWARFFAWYGLSRGSLASQFPVYMLYFFSRFFLLLVWGFSLVCIVILIFFYKILHFFFMNRISSWGKTMVI